MCVHRRSKRLKNNETTVAFDIDNHFHQALRSQLRAQAQAHPLTLSAQAPGPGRALVGPAPRAPGTFGFGNVWPDVRAGAAIAGIICHIGLE